MHSLVLKDALFAPVSAEYSGVSTENIVDTINDCASVRAFKKAYSKAFEGFDTYLHNLLITNREDLESHKRRDRNCGRDPRSVFLR